MQRKDWLPLILQTLTLLGGAWLFSQSQEHRMTVTEETLKAQGRIIEQIQQTQAESQRAVSRVIALEEFIHGLSPEEEAARSKVRNRPR